MSEQPTGYDKLFAGYEFPPLTYQIEAARVADYRQATQETDELFCQEGLVPPMAITALAMTALGKSITMPAGTIHVSQELEFLKAVKTGDTITCYSKVSRKVERGGLRLMNTDINVVNQDKEKILSGKVGFVLPPPVEGKPQ
jgi:hypothetical protein